MNPIVSNIPLPIHKSPISNNRQQNIAFSAAVAAYSSNIILQIVFSYALKHKQKHRAGKRGERVQLN